MSTRFLAVGRQCMLLASLLAAPVGAQSARPLPVLRATSKLIDIRDGDRYLRQEWAIDPATALDVYDVERSTSAKTVSFISDIDSITFTVEPRRTYDFAIVYNGKDTCRTRISSLISGAERVSAAAPFAPTIIPISIVRGKLHLHATVNGSKTLDLIFDTGSSANWLFRPAMNKGAGLTFDGVAQSVGMGGAVSSRRSNNNRLRIEGLQWEHEPFLFTEKVGAHREDGIIGYTVFANKVVEIDYDRMVMVIHDALPSRAVTFSRIPMTSVGQLTAVEVGFSGSGTRAHGQFILDAAAGGALNMNTGFAKSHGFPGALNVIGRSASSGFGSGTRSNVVVEIPELTIAGFTLTDVPVHVEVRAAFAESAAHGGTLNMEILRRFNTMFDYAHRTAYFKPNGQFKKPFQSKGMLASWIR